jgi:uncharacterized protein YecT (DUF1311 family)
MILRNHLLLTVVLFSLVGTPLVTRAQKVDCAKPKTLSIAGLADCANRELAATEVEMKQTFQEALSQYTPKAEHSRERHGAHNSATNQQAQWERRMRDDLIASQEAWLKYRKSACGAVSDMFGLGTSAEINVPECKADLTRARSKFLRTYFMNH